MSVLDLFCVCCCLSGCCVSGRIWRAGGGRSRRALQEDGVWTQAAPLSIH